MGQGIHCHVGQNEADHRAFIAGAAMQFSFTVSNSRLTLTRSRRDKSFQSGKSVKFIYV